jgi:hypothetical protein
MLFWQRDFRMFRRHFLMVVLLNSTQRSTFNNASRVPECLVFETLKNPRKSDFIKSQEIPECYVLHFPFPYKSYSEHHDAMANHHGFIVTVIAASVVALCCYQGLHRVPRAPIDAVFGERRRMTSWLSDPKTVILKSDAKIVAHDIQKLRYAAFGTSKTWGSGLDDPDREVRCQKTYPCK